MKQHWKKLLIIAGIAGLLIYAIFSVPTIFTSPKVSRLIEDPNLKEAIAESTGKPVYLDLLRTVTSLDLSDSKIENLSGLGYCTILVKLDLSDNHISRIVPLGRCPALKEIDLRSNKIVDISALSSLRHLSDLYLSDNGIVDLKPLVDNDDLSEGDFVEIKNNPLSEESINVYIPQLLDRGVIVEW